MVAAEKNNIAILLPARNEAGGIGRVIDEINALQLGDSAEIIVAENGSINGTAAVAEAKGASVIRCPAPGKGAAVRYALDEIAGRYGYIFMLDADYTYPAQYILPMLLELLDGAEVVMGARWKRQPGSMSALHWLGNRAISLEASILYGWVTDTLTGLWGFRADVIPALGLSSDGFTLEVDIYSGARLAGLKIREIPIEYRPRLGSPSKLKFRDAFLISSFLLKRRFQNGR